MLKKTLSLFVLQSLVMFPVLADNEKTTNDFDGIEVHECSKMVKFTNNPVKIISKDLFLDSDGYKVQACSVNNDIKFFKVTPFANGVEIYNNADKNEELNEGNTHIYNQEYSITYGDKNFEIQDRFDFQKEINKAFLVEEAPVGISSFVNEEDYDDTEKAIVFPSEWTEVGDKYINYIQKEKEGIIKEKYREIVRILKEKANQEKEKANEEFMKKATEMNKFFIHDNRIISQYSLEDNSNNLSVFLMYEGNLSGYKFYIASQGLLADFIANPNIGINEKLSVMENISDSFYTKKKDDFIELRKSKTQTIKTQKEMERKSSEDFSKLSDVEKKEFFEMLKNVNENIIKKEFTDLPEKITKEQYKTLSNIDKFKYLPELKGHYKDKNSYVKNKQDVVMSLTINVK